MKKIFFFSTFILISIVLKAQNWTQQNTNMSGTSIGVDQISVVDSNIVWINGFNGSGTTTRAKVCSRTQDGGTTWLAGIYNGFGATVFPQVLSGVTYNKAFAIAMDTASGGFASFWKTTDGGANWSLVTGVMNNGSTTFADGVQFWDSDKGYCYGDPVSGKFDIYYTTNGGTTWTPTLAANVTPPLSGEYGYNGYECATKMEGGYAAFLTNMGRVYKTSNYGVNWTVTATAPFTSIGTGKIYINGFNKMIIAGMLTGATTYTWKQTSDGGATWTSYSPAGTFYTYSMTYVPLSYNMMVSTSPFSTAKGVSYSNDAGATWTDYIDPILQPGGINIQCLGVGFADVNHGWVGNYGTSVNSILKLSGNLPLSAGNITGLTTVCQGQNSVTYTVPPVANATSYIWTLPFGATGTSTTNSITVNYGSSSVSGNITVKGYNANGIGAPSSLLITISPLPAIPGIISGTSNICQTQNAVTYTIPQIAYAVSYIWTLPAGATGNSNTNSIIVDYGTNSQSGYITVKGHNTCGFGDSASLSITVSTIASGNAGLITGPVNICQGQLNANYSVPQITGATSYIWTLPTGVIGSSTTNSIVVSFDNTFVSGNITVKGHNACGDGLPSALAITIDPLPQNAGTITGLTMVCQGQNNVNYTVPAIANASSYIWNLPDGASGVSNTNSITVNYSNIAISGLISVQGSNSCGVGISSFLTVAVNTLPGTAGTISGLINICQDQSNLIYTCALINNATSYLWTLPGGITGNSTTNSISVSTSANAISGYIIVKGHNNCGDGTENQLYVTVNPLPSSNIIGQTNSQAFQTETYSVTSQTACTYSWTVTNGNIISGQGSNSLEVQWGNFGTGQVNVTVSNSATSCSSSSQLVVNIGGNLPDAAGTITGVAIVCQGQNNVTYSVPLIQNASSYIWQLPDGSYDTTATNSIIINFPNNAQSGILTVKGHNALGEGISSTFTITINPTPTTPVITKSGNELISDATIGNQWYNLAGGIIYNATSAIYLPQQTGDYFVIVTLNGCSSDSSNLIYFDNTGIRITDNNQIIRIYPNPVQNELIIETEGNKGKQDFEILNSTGQLVFKGYLTARTVVQTTTFASGIYIIKLKNGKTFQFKKIVKE